VEALYRGADSASAAQLQSLFADRPVQVRCVTYLPLPAGPLLTCACIG
jgi:hypothetical protein